MKKFLDTCRRLLSIVLNLFVLCAEPIALPLSWEMGQAQIFTYYTEDSNILAAVVCAMVAVCQLCCPAGSSGSSSWPPAACCSPS